MGSLAVWPISLPVPWGICLGLIQGTLPAPMAKLTTEKAWAVVWITGTRTLATLTLVPSAPLVTIPRPSQPLGVVPISLIPGCFLLHPGNFLSELLNSFDKF